MVYFKNIHTQNHHLKQSTAFCSIYFFFTQRNQTGQIYELVGRAMY